MNKHFFALILCTTLGTQVLAQDVDLLSLKPKTSAKTGLLTAGAGITAGGLTLLGLSKLCSEVNHLGGTFRVAGGAFLPFRWIDVMIGFDRTVTLETDNSTIIAGLITTAAISVGAVAAWLMYRYQPEGRYGRAQSKVKTFLDDPVMTEVMEAEQTLIENIDNCYIHHMYPRVSACNDFLRYLKALEDSIDLFRAAIDGSNDHQLIEMARTCIENTKAYMTQIKGCVTIVRNAPDWIEQLKGHDAMLARQAQERAAFAAQQVAFNSWR